MASEQATYAEIIDVLDRLSNTVRETRRIRRLSLRAAADQIGVSFSTLDRFESRSARDIGIQLDPVVRIMRWLDSGADTDEPKTFEPGCNPADGCWWHIEGGVREFRDHDFDNISGFCVNCGREQPDEPKGDEQ